MPDAAKQKTEYQDSTMLVSVIVPVYNVGPYLEEALDSLTGQTYKDLEIIVVDDGSTDESPAICDSFAAKDGRIKVIHQSNKGLSSARNTGLAAMTGQLVAFLDSDDVMHPDMISRMVSALVKDDAEMAVCRFATFSDTADIRRLSGNTQGEGLALDAGVYGRTDALKAFVGKKIGNTVWNKIYRSSLWEGLRFPDGHVYEDTYTTFGTLDRSRKVSAISDILYYYRARKGSITRYNSVSNIRDFMLSRGHLHRSVEKLIPEVISEQEYEDLKRSCLTSAIFKFASLPADEEQKEEISALREEIISFGKSIDLSSSGFALRTAWNMLNKNPKALSAVYPVVRKAVDLSRSLKK